jgi:hypothetical protein
MKFTFDPIKHEYRSNGKVLPSVTQILSYAGIIPACGFYLPIHAERGRAVHSAAQMHIDGTLDEDSLHEIIRLYVFAFKDFLRESRFVPMKSFCEVPMRSELGFAGTADLVGTLNNNLAVIDVKTGDASAWAQFQTAGYELLYRETSGYKKEIKRFSLRLYPTGRYKLREHTKQSDQSVFLAALENYKTGKMLKDYKEQK